MTSLQEWQGLTNAQRAAWTAFAQSLVPVRGMINSTIPLTTDQADALHLYRRHRTYCLFWAIDSPPGAFYWEANWTGTPPDPTVMLGTIPTVPAMTSLRTVDQYPFDTPYEAVIPKKTYNTGAPRRRKNLPP